MKTFLVYLMLLLTAVSVSAQSTYYVSAAQGSDSNDGLSQEAAFANISQASSVSQPGDTIKILPGTYEGTDPNNLFDEFLIASSGSPGNYITYQGIADAQGNLPKLVSASLSGITVAGNSYVIVENLELVPGDEDKKGLIDDPNFGIERWRQRRAINIVNGSHHVIVRDLYIHDFPGNGIGIGGVDVVLIEDNLVEHCAYQTNNANSGISIYQPTLLAVPGFAEYPDHRLIFRNNVSRYNTNLRPFAARANNTLTDGNGIIIDDLRQAQKSEAERVPYQGRTLVIGNVCYGNGGFGINIFSSDRVDVYNNTMFDNGQSARIRNPAITVGVIDAQLQVGALDDVNVVNNILANANASTLTFRRFNATNLTFRNNLHWSTSGTVENVSESDLVADPEFVDASGLTPEQTELLATMTDPFDPNSPSAQLRTPTQNNGFPIPDLRLRAGSPAIDAGADVGFGNPLGAGIDIGALEYNPTNTPEPPTPTGNVTVRARGVSGSEQLEIRYNDQRVGDPITLSTSFQEYRVRVDNPTDNFKVAFINDASDRDAVVDWLRMGSDQKEAEAQDINTAAWFDGSCGNGTRTQVMNCNGFIDFGSFEDDGSSETGTIAVRAKGDCGNETMELRIDGQLVDTWEGVSTTYATYTYEGFSGSGEVSVHFVNDSFGGNDPACEDANLEIDYIEVCDTRYQTEEVATETANCCLFDEDKLYTVGNFNYGTLSCSTSARQNQVSNKETVGETKMTGVRVYPNPTAQQVMVEGPASYHITLYDLRGIAVQRTSARSGKSQLDVAQLLPGTYILRMTDTQTQQTYHERLLIE